MATFSVAARSALKPFLSTSIAIFTGTLVCAGLATACSKHEEVAKAAAPQAIAAQPAGLLSVGTRAPDIVGTDAQGKAVRLSQIGQRYAVVYFYPKDETPGCTKEALAFRDAFPRFEQAGVVIFGVSRDSEQSHTAFRKHHELPFPLVSDTSGQIQNAYGVPSRFPGIASRVSFLVDRSGLIARVWPNVDPSAHVDEVLAAVQSK